ncbi:alpha/beta fold hydrolase [Salinarimonas soli]|uniref:Alpha/beta hydrolase n=1 Tax=Salinarimonas soli TaxID=1638099 RepID=A0A5B2W1L6_9HYPH|nr:alpha/beta hydrolase [Salinarimonas soli]KAA2244357.1 alpha/beta hydrolase [Salinarimonas soli]
MTNRTFQGAHGNALAATVAGPGPRTALLLHGGGQTRHAWGQTTRRLAARGWRAIALDQRGHGDSAWVADGLYSFPVFAADAAAVARQIADETGRKPVAIGASLGGIAALHALGESGEPVFAGLVLVDIVPRMDPGGVDHIQGFMRARAREGFATIEEAADAVAAYLPHRPRPTSLDGLRKNLRQHPDGRWRWHWDPSFLDGPSPVGRDRETVEAALVRAAAGLSVPTLLVRGGSSELVTPEAVAEFRALAPHAEYANVAEARHMVAGDRNDAFGAAVEDFLARRFPEA